MIPCVVTRRSGPHRPLGRVARSLAAPGGVGAAMAVAGLLAAAAAGAEVVPVEVAHTPWAVAPACSGGFVRHDLPHATLMEGDPPQMFDGNGAGVALADLDGDGLIDIALAGLRAPVTLLWNRGGLRFERVELPAAATRAINALDLDGDGAMDLVVTRSGQRPQWWRGVGERSFSAVPDDADFIAWFPIYAMAWADLDGDLDLDLVGASYDAELEKLRMREVYLNFAARTDTKTPLDGGVFYYENTGERLRSFPLARQAEALAIALLDLDHDGRRDILIGNDYDTPDYVYLNTEFGWRLGQPFIHTTFNTMGYAEGDVDNDGTVELLAADMQPYREGADVDAAWAPIWNGQRPEEGDEVQIVANVLQVRAADGSYVNRAPESGLAATGWTWSVQFGDLDHDGLLDVYAVNGMIGMVFDHLPDAELIEENQALRNTGAGGFVPVPEWGLAATEGGRGMAMADLDLDGDLDLVVNNVAAPSILFENQVCGATAGAPGASVEVDLRWHGSPNPRAVGARLQLATTSASYLREVRVASGYLSSEPARVHFGLPADTGPLTLTVTWPDGATSTVTGIKPDHLLTIERAEP